MSTASPLPLQPLPPGTASQDKAQALKQEIASRLAEHRQRRGRSADTPSSTPVAAMRPRSRVADSVAARFAQTVSYSDFLKQEAEAAIRQAEAAAEVARRNAEAIAAAQQQLLDEIVQWERQATKPQESGPADVIAFAPPVETAPPLAPPESASAEPETAPVQPLAATADTHLLAEANSLRPPDGGETASSAATFPVASAARAGVRAESFTPAMLDFAEVFTAAVNEIQERPATLAERLGLATGPLEASVPLPTNLIEFPRQLIAARKARPRLAEGPLRDEADASPERAQLRIFEVEANSVSTQPAMESGPPEWQTIRLDADATPRTAELPDAQISFALPLYVAHGSQRIMAFAVDACCVVTGFLAAVAVASYASPVLPTGVPAAIAAAVALFLFAIGYQILFFSLSDATPGMRYARLGFCTFNDENPTRKALRNRIFALLLAGIPLGLGLLWACMDEERLGWHDRISRMYPRAY